MKDTKLINLLRSFSENEFIEFGLFVRSPFASTNKRIPQLYNALKKYYPSFDQRTFTSENLYKKIYPGKVFNEKTLRYLLTEMYKIAEQFIDYLGVTENALYFNWNRLKQYHKRNLELQFSKSVTSLGEELEGESKRNDDHYFFSYLLKKEFRTFYEKKHALGKRGEFFNELNDEIQKFVEYFVYKMLKYYANQRNLGYHLNYEHDYIFREQVMNYAGENLLNDPVISMFYYLNRMHDGKNENDYYELKNLVSANYNILEENDAILLYTELYNFSRLLYLGGKIEFNRENFELLKEILRLEIYPKENGYITEQSFITYVSVGLMVKEFDWVAGFLDEHTNNLSPGARNDAYNYCMGLLSFKKGELDEALNYFNKVQTKDYFYYLRIKNNLLKVFYEKKDVESVLTNIDSFKHFLSFNQSIPAFISQRFITFLNYLNKLVKLENNSSDMYDFVQLRNDITAEGEFENRSWLLEKIKTLLKEPISIDI